MNKFFTADTHFGHRLMLSDRVPRPRPWDTVEEMNEALIEAWNAKIGQHDLVYHLGDFSFMRREPTQKIFDRLNGQIHLVRGNHERVVPKGVTWVKDYYETKIGEVKVCLFHYACAVWNKSHYGSWHLYGHSHGSFSGACSQCGHVRDIPRLDVGVDAREDYSPWSAEEIALTLTHRGYEGVDHHEV